MEEPTLKDLPHLILMNKNDLDEFKGVENISDKMKLYSLKCNEYVMLSISALQKTGIVSAMNWIMETIRSTASQNARVMEEKV
jgi:signal recognition particle receptor subunit beta